MSRKKIIIILVLLIVLVLGGIGIFKVINNNNDNDEVMSDIRKSYVVVKREINSYNNARDGLINLMNSFYSSKLEEDYDKFMNGLKDEEELVGNISNEVKKLDDLCLDRLFKEVEVNNICNDYKEYYETIVNVYLNDINKVNGFIDSYNSEYSKNLEHYKSDLVTDYIDYNNDGKYLERVDSNE